MTTQRRTTVLAALLAVLLAGCSSPGALVSRHEPDAVPEAGRVVTAGTYELFIAGQAEPLLQYPLKAGDRLGFDQSVTPATDQLQVRWLYAVAGTDRRRLDVRQTYEWRRLNVER